MDGGTSVATAVSAAAQAPLGPQIQQQVQQPQASAQLVWQLVPLLALALVFVVELVRALPWSESARARMGTVMLLLWPTLVLGVTLGVWQSALWALWHVLPAGGLALLLLRWMPSRSTRTEKPSSPPEK